MNRILMWTCLAAALAAGFAGCQSTALKSDDAATRMKAVREIKEQDDLLDVARDKDYPNDVRLDALGRLSNQRNIWRVWCENGENQELAAKALAELTDEDILVRVALLHSYEESAEEKEERESAEKRKNLAFGATALAVNAGGAAAMGKAKGAGGQLAAVAGTKAANDTLAMAKAYSDQKEPEPDMAVRTNEALVAVGKLKTLPAISAVALNSTVECIQLVALRKLLRGTPDMQMLKDVALQGYLKDARITGYRSLRGGGEDIETQNKIIAIGRIKDAAALKDIIDRGYGESPKYAFGRLIQVNAFDGASEMLCKHNPQKLMRLGDRSDVPDAAAEKIVARFPETRQCVALALGSKSDAIGKAAIAKLADRNALEDVIMAGGTRSDYAISVLKDGAYVLELFKKAKKLDVRLALAKKIAVKDITVELFKGETEMAMRKVLLERASEEVRGTIRNMEETRCKELLAEAKVKGKDTFELGGFYLGMSISDVDLLVRHYFPDWSNEISGQALWVPQQERPFCRADDSGKVYQFNFGKAFLKKWYDYDVQTYAEWARRYSRDTGISMRSKVNSDDTDVYLDLNAPPHKVLFAQHTYQYKHNAKGYRLIYFGEEVDMPVLGEAGGLAKNLARKDFKNIRGDEGMLCVQVEED